MKDFTSSEKTLWAQTSFRHFTYIIMFSIRNQSMMKQLLSSWLQRRRLRLREVGNLTRAIYLVRNGLKICNSGLLILMSVLFHYAVLLLREYNCCFINLGITFKWLLASMSPPMKLAYNWQKTCGSNSSSIDIAQKFDQVNWKKLLKKTSFMGPQNIQWILYICNL